MHDIETHLTGIKARWLIGGTAAEQTPPDWRDLVGSGSDAELRLVALVGQAAQVGFRPVPGDQLVPRPPLPRLPLPSPPDPARTRFRRLQGPLKANKAQLAAVLNLLAARGYAAHPADWMPGAGDEAVPDLYAPWIDWQAPREGEGAADELTLETWDHWLPGERRAALRALRRSDPAAAGELIAAKAPEVKADQRLRLLELLPVGLSEQDVPLLEKLAGDRSPKVKDLAARLLARLGRAQESNELVAELAEFLKVGAGVLSRQKSVTAKKLKNNAQRTRRRQLFEIVTLTGLARALDLSELDLVRAWSPNREAEATAAFVAMVAETGADDLQLPCIEKLLEEPPDPISAIAPLADRLDARARQEVTATVMKQDDQVFEATVACAGEDLGNTPLEKITATAGFRALMATLKTCLADEQGKRRQEDFMLSAGLANLGLLADQACALALIDRLTASGLMAADPKLDLLNLNAALKRRSDHE